MMELFLISLGDEEIVKALLRKGTNVNAVDNVPHPLVPLTPLQYAAAFGKHFIFHLIHIIIEF